MDLLDIAIGKHLNTKTWQNKQVSVETLAKMCSTPVVTNETYAAYLKMPKEEQDRLKAVGSFFGGYLPNGVRKKTNVLHRSIITTDLDFADLRFIEDYEMLFGYEAIIYSTRKHSSEKPRFRLILIPDRDIPPDEYEPAARKTGEMFGIEQCDHTSFRVTQFMHLPSTSKDGEFIFKYIPGPRICVDEVLGMYRNWRDQSEWPVTSRETKQIKDAAFRKQTQQDPREKAGLIGLFCQAYPTVADVIYEYLPDVYEETDMQGRWTYRAGSGHAGAVEYTEGLFLYSNHLTDPAYGKLCNVLDLVRIHLYESMDANVSEDTPINKKPSFLAMLDLIRNDPKVKALNAAAKFAEAGVDFGQLESGEELAWISKAEFDTKGRFITSPHNIELILRSDPALKGRFKFNEFSEHINIQGPVPWDSVPGIRQIADNDVKGLRNYLGKNPYNIKRSPIIDDTYPLIAKENQFHPIREYLVGLQWDGIARVDTLLTDYLGAEDTPLARAFIRKTLCAAVTRVFRPGAKFDYILTLISTEGTKKSTLAKSLGKEWFSETFNFSMLHGGNGVRAQEQVRGVWIIEIPEMSGLNRAEVEAAKSFITTTVDRYRVTRGEHQSSFKRQCVFIGSSNNEEFLSSQTGNRRFWPVVVFVNTPKKTIAGEFLDPYEVDQIWAEAFVLHKTELLYLTPELEALARETQSDHTVSDERQGLIHRFLEMRLPDDWDSMEPVQRKIYFEYGDASKPGLAKRNRVCAAEIWVEALGGSIKDMSSQNTRFIHNIMRKMTGWKPYKSKTVFKVYGNQKGYYRTGSENPVRGAVSEIGADGATRVAFGSF
ncbi:Virulence-associated protein E [Dyadobacter soli]|uniref:Virulence-associated protein E n=1 Tax=Dyadobacter soli TaxID=659014 RepID=A0A1G7G4Y5_9BACT|nr:virulence-associated E family protein [Dyadobacter soli]SDE83226.1 Virulence-associated protein E [Dyadobacter soli]